jgi:hypothetical protein
MVIPRSRSALSLSKTHAYLKEPLPNSAASWRIVSRNPDDQNSERLRQNQHHISGLALLGAVVKYITKRENCDVERSSEKSAPPRGTPNDKPEQTECEFFYLTFSNFSMVRLSIPPHL